MMKKATGKEGKAETLVYWDIKEFPVPLGFDARRIRPCIDGLLVSNGYSGPVTIYAVGILTDVHVDILGALSSTGIILLHSAFCVTDILVFASAWMHNNSPPANILIISDPDSFPTPPSGYNLFSPFPYSSPQEDAISWINLILTMSGTLEEDKCSETYESTSWFCSICRPLPAVQSRVHSDVDLYGTSEDGFETFTSHLSS
ncbi:uncharacterized protein LOC17884572 isoform X2 [Capsella rubella]|uniref:uncharacterized protein LOC17884572 isoform X2 n=1 Tax=Capsella rubella TaxID=81985 RepID=UPI000CD5BD14|nr:uncharacterized protein LOC17884572 isoform X2 [Capsella rubella]